jgi:hypothetical protein
VDTQGKFPNNPTLYAHWQKAKTADYTVMLWRQNLSDNGRTAANTYAFADSFKISNASTINNLTLNDVYKQQANRDQYNSLNNQRTNADGSHPARLKTISKRRW